MIYLASGYSHPEASVRQRNYEDARRAVGYLSVNSHEVVFSSIVYYHHVAIAHKFPTDVKFWQALNTEWLRRADMLYLLDNEALHDSEGCAQEYALAKSLGIQVQFCNEWGLPTLPSEVPEWFA